MRQAALFVVLPLFAAVPALAGTANSYFYGVFPMYGAALAQAPAAQPQPAAAPDRLDAIERKLDRLLSLLEGLLKEETPAPANNDIPPALQSGMGKCWNCHEPRVATDKGGGFVIFSEETPGALRKLSARDLRKIITEVSDGTMPIKEAVQKDPKLALTKEEQSELLKVFKTLASPPKGN